MNKIYETFNEYQLQWKYKIPGFGTYKINICSGAPYIYKAFKIAFPKLNMLL